ncbi:MAG TPA: hypothetical protein V6D34_16875, partial [Candidatus Sericytochromatia bacterium]
INTNYTVEINKLKNWHKTVAVRCVAVAIAQTALPNAQSARALKVKFFLLTFNGRSLIDAYRLLPSAVSAFSR